MSVDLELIPHTRSSWAKKKPVILYYKGDMHIRNWNDLYDILFNMPKQSVPTNVAVLEKTGGEYMFHCDDLYYLPAGKIVSAMKRAFKKWGDVDPQFKKWEAVDPQFKEESDRIHEELMRIMNRLKRLRPSTPVILSWW